MKKVFTLALLSLAMMVSCTKENEKQTAQAQKQEFSKFYAAMEGADSRTFVDEDYQLHWTADDRITIFDGNTYPLQYKFMGETGDNQGEFDVVQPAGYYAGSAISANYAVYPYDENTLIAYDGTISYTVPATQQYAVNSFGLGANPMVAITNGVNDKFLAFKNLDGCFEFPLYGYNDNVKVKSIVFRGNNNEKLAGAATITAAYGEEPTMAFGDDATEEITLDCGEEGVLLSTDAENPTKFWIAVPAITFEQGFTITITDTNDIVTEKRVETEITIGRCKVQPFANALQLRTIQNNEIWYTSRTDANNPNGIKIEPQFTDRFGDGVTYQTNEYNENIGYWVITFSNDVTTIGEMAFSEDGKQKNLLSIIIPEGVTSIGTSAFYDCYVLTSINIPDGVTSIGESAFYGCYELTSINIPEGVTSIGARTFEDCRSLVSITIPDGVTSIGESAFSGCGALTSINIPDGITSIEKSTFYTCHSLTSINIPNSVEKIGNFCFAYCI